MPNPLDVLSLDKAKEHLQQSGPNVQPGGDGELTDMIGAAVERVQRHLGRWPDSASFSEVLACKTVLAEYWETQMPARTSRQAYGGAQNAFSDDGPAVPVSLAVRLTALLGSPVAPPGEQPQGSFPAAQVWPDPVRISGPSWWPW